MGWTALAFPVVTGVTWWSARHPPAWPRRLVEWLVCGLLILSGASLLWSGWRASQPEALVPGDAMALLTVLLWAARRRGCVEIADIRRCADVQMPGQHYDMPMTSVYAQRRARLAAQLGDGGVAIIPTAPELHRNRDTEYLYRHDSYFYYLTGFSEPNACLVLTSDGKSVLFCQPKDLEREVWTGYRLGPGGGLGKLGVDRPSPATRSMPACRACWKPRACLVSFATHKGLAEQVEGWLSQVRARSRFGVICPTQQGDACALLDEMRLVKDAHEQDIMRRAGRSAPRPMCAPCSARPA
jgi:hypothetical protein